jgi:hypothetical protein
MISQRTSQGQRIMILSNQRFGRSLHPTTAKVSEHHHQENYATHKKISIK